MREQKVEVREKLMKSLVSFDNESIAVLKGAIRKRAHKGSLIRKRSWGMGIISLFSAGV